MKRVMHIPNQLQAARLLATRRRPYLASALWALQPRASQTLPFPMAVDQQARLYYRPEYLDQWTADECAAVLYHEVCHLLRDHAGRCEQMQADPLLWNIATDAEINDDLIQEQEPLPGSPITPETINQPENLLAETYYRALEKRVESKIQTACGSCAHGKKEPWEESASTGNDTERLRLVRHQVAQEIMQAQSSASSHSFAAAVRRHYQPHKGRSLIPGHWQRWAETILKPRIDWRRELAAHIRQALANKAGAVDYSYSRPSRRQAALPNVRLPALCAPALEVAIIVDTSGSMDEDLLTQALCEVQGILRAVGVDGVHVLSCDTQVHITQRVFRVDQVRLFGGGGTNMGAGLIELAYSCPRPQVVVVLTDMQTPWPEKAPPFSTIIGSLSKGYSQKAPTWARLVHVE